MSKPKRPRAARPALADARRITAGGAHHRAPAWSRDGRQLVFAAGHKDDSAWVVVDRRGRVVRVLEGPAAGTATFGPDGSIAFERRFGGTSEIWLTPGGDAPPVRLLGGDGRLYRDPAFSPDGTRLACAGAEDGDGRTHLYLVPLDTGRPSAITAVAARSDARPTFTPSGEELLFEAALGDDRAIYALHLERSALERLTPEGERARRPAALDDGRVLYERERADGQCELALLDRTTGAAVALDGEAPNPGDPACAFGKGGKLRVAYAAEGHTPGEPPRFDIYVAKLRGLGKRKPARRAAEAGAEPEAAAHEAPDAGRRAPAAVEGAAR